MHKEMVITFKCNLSNGECKTILLDCNKCNVNKSKDKFFPFSKTLVGVPMHLNEDLTIAKVNLDYLAKVISHFDLVEVNFSDISKELCEKYPKYRKLRQGVKG